MPYNDQSDKLKNWKDKTYGPGYKSFPTTNIISNNKNKTTSNKRRKKKSNIVRGKEVTVKESSSEMQLIYGRMKVGGITTYIATNDNSKAYLVTGDSSDNDELIWTAKTAGAAGNSITITIVNPGGTNTSTDYSVVGNDITVTLKTSGGSITADMNNVISRIASFPAADALVRVQKKDANKNGIVQARTLANLSYGGGTWLHQVTTLSGHEIDAVEELYLNNEAVVFGAVPDGRWGTGKWAGKVFMAAKLGEDSQTVQADLKAQKPTEWTDDHRQRGCALIYTIFVWDNNLWPEGDPELSCLVRGKKCYDPRSGLTVWTQNSALIVADFMMNNKYGLGIPFAEIDMVALEHAADICDAGIDLNPSGTEPQFTTNGVWDFSQSKEDILNELLACMDGEVVKQGDKWIIYASEYRTPSITITEDDFRGGFSINTKVSRSDSFNIIRGTFVDPKADYNETDIPAIRNSTYITEDGIERYEDITLNGVTSSGQAQRLLKIQLERSRQGITFIAPLTLLGLKHQVNDNVYVTLPRYGWSAKVFEVQQVNFVIEDDGTLGVDLELRENVASIFEWNNGEETIVDNAPDSELPNPSEVEPPADLLLESGTDQLYKRLDGTIATRLKVSWTASVTPFVVSGGTYLLEYKLSSEGSTAWKKITLDGTATFHFILDIEDGQEVDVKLKALNSLGYSSSYISESNYEVIGKTELPSDVTGFSVTLESFGIFLQWTDITDIDKKDYEIRVGANWAAGTLVDRVEATSYRWNVRTAGTYNLMIKARDTTKNYSATEASDSLTINAPAAPTVDSSLAGENVVFTWNEPTADFAIREYEIRYGASYAAGTPVAIVTAKSFSLRVNWSGARTFWIAARDVADNTGTAGTEVVTILSPNPVTNFNTASIKNNVLLDWTEPVITSLPIAKYQVYKGSTFALASYIGFAFGSFHTYLEQAPGLFVYWVVCEDTAGNLSTEVESAPTQIVVPSDFYILEDEALITHLKDPGAIVPDVNYVAHVTNEPADRIFLPVTTGLPVAAGPPGLGLTKRDALYTREEIFIARGWTSEADAIAAGYVSVLTPSNANPGEILFEIDYGVILSDAVVAFTYDVTQLGVNPIELTPGMEFSEDGVTWSVYDGYSQIFQGGFRYARYKISWSGQTDFDACYIENARATLQLPKDEDNITVSAASSDVAGTTVNFTKTFLDVEDIQVTALGNDFANAVPDYNDAINPGTGLPDQFLKVYVFDKDGLRITRNVKVRVRGAILA